MSSATKRGSARGWNRLPFLGLMALLSFLACDPRPIPERAYLETFEDECDGGPCGWERSAGDPNQALWVETIHPGEHGLRLVGEVTVRGPAAPLDALRVAGDDLSIRVAARCDPGSTLEVDVVLTDDLGGSILATTSLNPDEQWRDVTTSNLRLERPASSARVSAIGIRKTGDGACEIDELVIDATFFDATGC